MSNTRRIKNARILPDHRVETDLVNYETLDIAGNAQRCLNDRRAKGIARKMQPTALGVFTVSRRLDGRDYTVDGQHRLQAIRLYVGMLREDILSLDPDTDADEIARIHKLIDYISEVRVERHFDLTLNEESILFLIKNDDSAAVNAMDKFIIASKAGMEPQASMFEIFVSHGLGLKGDSRNSDDTTRNNLITAGTRNYEQLVDRYNPRVMDAALTVAENVWGRTPKTWNANLIIGIGMFLAEHPGIKSVDLEAKIKTYSKLPGNPLEPSDWLCAINARATNPSGYVASSNVGRMFCAYSIFVDAYNAGRRSRKITLAPR